MLSLRKFIYLTGIFTLCLVSCNKNKDAEKLSNTFCECGEPLMKWKKELEFHYEKLKEGNEISMQVEDCLKDEKPDYMSRRDDEQFKRDVAALVNEQCPDLVNSLPALFNMLFRE